LEGLTLVGYRKAQEESDPQVSEEENIQAVEVETITVTPKKNGVKYVYVCHSLWLFF
jgi:hypothetical protein